jgi:hypothetical protein
MTSTCPKRSFDHPSKDGKDEVTLDVNRKEKQPKILTDLEKAKETVFIHNQKYGRDAKEFNEDFARIGKHIEEYFPKVTGEDLQEIYDNAIGEIECTKFYGAFEESTTDLYEAVKLLPADEQVVKGFTCTLDKHTNNIKFTAQFTDIDGTKYEVDMEYEDGQFVVNFVIC